MSISPRTTTPVASKASLISSHLSKRASPIPRRPPYSFPHFPLHRHNCPFFPSPSLHFQA
ncbi:hypothetical protein BC830DRAFT_1134711 [Chytriomyces sp. MP71]|nr:hypothetical protein BC830DRAFT_1134711 [Chytriomyces sp. MP71]